MAIDVSAASVIDTLIRLMQSDFGHAPMLVVLIPEGGAYQTLFRMYGSAMMPDGYDLQGQTVVRPDGKRVLLATVRNSIPTDVEFSIALKGWGFGGLSDPTRVDEWLRRAVSVVP